MSLMISVSGIRGVVGESLSPAVLTSFTQAFAAWVHTKSNVEERTEKNALPKIVIGRDTRPTGEAVSDLVAGTLALSGCRVVDLGIATTPTVEIATTEENADGGIIITASHNPVEWNALKLLNRNGEFLNETEVQELLDIFRTEQFTPADWAHVGSSQKNSLYDTLHIDRILALSSIDIDSIAAQRFRVLVDAVEGAGSSIVPELCRKLGVSQVETIFCNGSGIFPRNPEPLPENLTSTVEILKDKACDFAIVVDPDVDRLALICEDGSMFGEEYSLVVCADFYLRHKKGAVVNNLSSSRALRDIAEKHGQSFFSAKVGEANVVDVMKEKNAVIGGEGNGGIILPELHYGRDALAGIALMLQAFTDWREKSSQNRTLSGFRKCFPDYFMAKHKIRLAERPENFDSIFNEISRAYPEAEVNREDGLKLDFPEEWVHIRPSNTEPVLRIYTEAKNRKRAEMLADTFSQEISSRIETL
ncbi:MAG: phosphoglucosamine mutase [Ignavibacteriaceae bacterium]|nr:phosphoglucosamine mutase [Ignavibacteriaceae bacterium]